MNFKTNISESKNNEHSIYGHSVAELLARHSARSGMGDSSARALRGLKVNNARARLRRATRRSG